VHPEVVERVLSRPRARDLRELEPLHLEGARARFGGRISDEELLLRLTMPQEQVDAIGTQPGPERSSTASRQQSVSRRPASHPVATLLDEVARRLEIAHLRVETDDELVEWRRPA
jgi:oxaloacetate decarboxylase alpha subunit